MLDGGTREVIVAPGDFGIETADLSEVEGGTPEQNAEMTRAVLAGEASPRTDLVLLNAAAAIQVGGRAGDLAEAVELARRSIESGAAAQVLSRLVSFTADQ